MLRPERGRVRIRGINEARLCLHSNWLLVVSGYFVDPDCQADSDTGDQAANCYEAYWPGKF